MEETYSKLYEFVDVAEKSRKYPTETANALKVALRLFEAELNDEETKSVEIFSKRLESVYLSVFNKNKMKMTTGSLDAYKRRILRVLRDYSEYGNNPTKMANWNPVIVTRSRKSKKNVNQGVAKVTAAVDTNQTAPASSLSGLPTQGANRFELYLRENVYAQIITPKDLTKNEAKKIKAYIDYLETVAVID